MRLFGNVMSGHLVVGLLVALAGFLVPMPIMALDMLIGLLQAYIFTVLSTVYIGAAISSGEESMTDQSVIAIVSIAAAALTMAVGAVGAALGESRIGAAAMDALARQPDEASSITRTLFVSLAMVESTAIFCLVIALIVLFANPFIAGRG